MLIRARSIIGLPIIEMIGLKKIATVSNILVDPENGAIIALLLKKDSFLDRNKIVANRDVKEFFSDAVMIHEFANIVEASEVVRAKDILVKKTFLLQSKVFTAEGKFLGYLEDFVFDQDFSQLMTLVVKKRFSQERRIISAERIINISSGRIIIRDAGIKMPSIKNGKIVDAPAMS